LAVVGRLRGRCEILYRVCSAPPHQDALPATIQAHTAHDYVSIVCYNAWEHRGAPLGYAVPRTLIGEHLQASNGPPSSTPGVHPHLVRSCPRPLTPLTSIIRYDILLVTEDSGWGVKRGYYWSFTTACLSVRCWPGQKPSTHQGLEWAHACRQQPCLTLAPQSTYTPSSWTACGWGRGRITGTHLGLSVVSGWLAGGPGAESTTPTPSPRAVVGR
jgi:hypothetical protein